MHSRYAVDVAVKIPLAIDHVHTSTHLSHYLLSLFLTNRLNDCRILTFFLGCREFHDDGEIQLAFLVIPLISLIDCELLNLFNAKSAIRTHDLFYNRTHLPHFSPERRVLL